MPGADISQVQVTFGNGIKREEYGPLKKAEVTIISIVGQGEDGVVALNYISKIAQDKVRELLTIQGQPAAAAAEPSPAPGVADKGSPDTAGEGEQRRTRRTKEQIAADNAAAEAAKAAAAAPAAPAASETPAADTPPATGGDTASDDEWAAAAPSTVTITDQELNHACSETAGRCGDPSKVKATIGLFSPGGDAFDVDKGGRKFTISDIPQNQRADFLAKLKAL